MKDYIKTAILFGMMSLLSVSSAFSASILLTSQSTSFVKDQEFLVDIWLDSEGKSLNTVSGQLNFPENLLEIKEIRDGGSIINFWVERPAASSTVRFSGIVPGGYNGRRGSLFSIIFRAKEDGKGAIEARNIEIFQNDGASTQVDAHTSPFNFSIEKDSASDLSVVSLLSDQTPPEVFTGVVAQDTGLFEGRAFLVFTTQDKGSGIDHYEIKEGVFGKFFQGVSPYLLTNQNLDKKIYIKAFDKNGNTRVSVVYGENWKPWYRNYLILSLAILFVLGLFVSLKKGLF